MVATRAQPSTRDPGWARPATFALTGAAMWQAWHLLTRAPRPAAALATTLIFAAAAIGWWRTRESALAGALGGVAFLFALAAVWTADPVRGSPLLALGDLARPAPWIAAGLLATAAARSATRSVGATSAVMIVLAAIWITSFGASGTSTFIIVPALAVIASIALARAPASGSPPPGGMSAVARTSIAAALVPATAAGVFALSVALTQVSYLFDWDRGDAQAAAPFLLFTGVVLLAIATAWWHLGARTPAVWLAGLALIAVLANAVDVAILFRIYGFLPIAIAALTASVLAVRDLGNGRAAPIVAAIAGTIMEVMLRPPMGGPSPTPFWGGSIVLVACTGLVAWRSMAPAESDDGAFPEQREDTDRR